MTRRWLGALAAAIAFGLICIYLGSWQYGRYEDRSAAARAVRTNYGAEPVPLEDVLPAGGTLADAQVWTKVEARGRYATGEALMVRNRPQNVTYGFEALTPLDLRDGTALLVDRGWVANGPRADVIPDVPAAPQGEVRVTGWLRQGEPSLDREMPGRLLASINLSEAAQKSGSNLRDAYLVLESEDVGDGQEPPRPAPLLPPDTDTGPHFAYAMQWWLGSLAGFVIVGVYLRREVQDAREAATPESQRVPAKPRKRRIWDEEDE